MRTGNGCQVAGGPEVIQRSGPMASDGLDRHDLEPQLRIDRQARSADCWQLAGGERRRLDRACDDGDGQRQHGHRRQHEALRQRQAQADTMGENRVDAGLDVRAADTGHAMCGVST